MPTKKNNSRLGEIEAQKRAAERQETRIKRWQQIAFVAISVIVLLSMILTLFMR